MKYKSGLISILLLTLTIVGYGCSSVEAEKKLPKTDERLIYISIDKYSQDGNITVGVNDTKIFESKKEQAAVSDIISIFNSKESVEEKFENPAYRIIFLYNLDPKQSKVRDEFMGSDRFQVADKDGLLVQNEETKETFRISGEGYDKLSKYLE
ncbi:hypothetical protein [Clostridium sp. 'White wine YQ']|uniref:hypothetical protein n=1 Tax=Clostridium sp. 'White wine YQ' TaxID=3027474 RepID=UPI0023654B54|nr:hypothetical protein [Clostridium sp. 'White wine YQ']MDD7794431.1 hypothetical protein [Clostridium sp. 'White wine YQ']